MKSAKGIMILAIGLASFGITAGASSARTEEMWRPTPSVTWQWQPGGSKVDTFYDVDAYDIDGFDNGKSTVDRLHADGSRPSATSAWGAGKTGDRLRAGSRRRCSATDTRAGLEGSGSTFAG